MQKNTLAAAAPCADADLAGGLGTKRPMEQPGILKYKADASFDKAVSLYEFDSKLRLLIFSAIQVIEISLRSKVINRFSLTHGAFWFMNPDMATDKHKFTENLGTLERELQRSKDDFIKEHCKEI